MKKNLKFIGRWVFMVPVKDPVTKEKVGEVQTFVDVHFDEDAIARQVGSRAACGKTGTARFMGGSIVAKRVRS